MTRFTFIPVLLAFEIAAGLLLLAEDLAPPPDPRLTPVTQQEVWQAVVAELQERGSSESRLPRIVDLDLPVALPAVAGRKLRVASSCWDEGRQRTQFRLECGEPGQCLPFLAYVHVHGHHDDDDESKAESGAQAGLCRPASGLLRPPPQAPPKSLLQPTMRAGDRATAVFVSGPLRITASVTCLERGHEGDIIRVRNQDGEVFRARISGTALLDALPQ